MKKIVFMAILYGISCANFLNAEIHTKINSDYIKHCKKGTKGACEMLNDYLIEMDKKCDKNDFKACVLAGLAISINDLKSGKIIINMMRMHIYIKFAKANREILLV